MTIPESTDAATGRGAGQLAAMLDLQRVDDDVFEVPGTPAPPDRLFGGQVASQTLKAACSTVEGPRRPHSLHAYFVLGGRPEVPIRFSVRRVRDGRSFSTRHVVAAQQGAAIFEMLVSFHTDEDANDWQRPAPADAPRPDELEPLVFPGELRPMQTFDVRPLRPPTPDQFPSFAIHPYWIRCVEPLGDDPTAHTCALTYLSDLAVVMSCRAPGTATSLQGSASLDHAVWFHRQARADQWLLYSVEPAINAGARGLAHGTLHDAGGRLVASVAQEDLLRPTH